jgi:hypothetical protein
VREPDFHVDGWSLDDGEEYHDRCPSSFSIPSKACRDALEPGGLVKLIFRIAVDNPDDPVSVERMWVIVRERTANGYLGVLDNDPDAIAENDRLWHGIELPFAARHVIDFDEADDNTFAIAAKEPTRRWATS